MDTNLFENKHIIVIDRDGKTVLKKNKLGQVAVLPYRINPDDSWDILVRIEPMPARNFRKEYVALTGSMDEGEDPVETALRELYEEAGYTAGRDKIKPLGDIYESKKFEDPLHAFAVDVTGLNAVEPPGDGSKLETQSSAAWITEVVRDKMCMQIKDGVFLSMVAKFVCLKLI